MSCTSITKDGSPCPNQAVCTVFWPGQTCEKCAACALRCLEVASAMEFALTVRPYPTLVPFPPSIGDFCRECGELDCEHKRATVRP